jgi:hypothetical protein
MTCSVVKLVVKRCLVRSSFWSPEHERWKAAEKECLFRFKAAEKAGQEQSPTDV